LIFFLSLRLNSIIILWHIYFRDRKFCTAINEINVAFQVMGIVSIFSDPIIIFKYILTKAILYYYALPSNGYHKTDVEPLYYSLLEMGLGYVYRKSGLL